MTLRSKAWDLEEGLSFWHELYPDVALPAEIWNELSDYYHVMKSMQELVPYVTNNRVSKINTHIEVIKSLHDDAVSELVIENVVEEMQDLLDQSGVEYDRENTDPNYLRIQIINAITGL